MAFTLKILAAAAATVVSAGAANASVIEAAVTYGTAPSTWIVLISGLAMVGLALGGTSRRADTTGRTEGGSGRREQPATGSGTASTTMRFKMPMARSSANRSSPLSRLGPPSSTPARARYSLAV